MTGPTLTWEQVRARRLARSYLLEPAPRWRLAAVVAAVGGIQAQVASAAELQVMTRVAGVDREAVRAELWQKRSLVKSYGVRGTLHLLPRDEVPMWAAALEWETDPWYERHGFTKRQAGEILRATGDALDGRTLTRKELAEEVGRRAGPKVRALIGTGWAHLLRPARRTRPALLRPAARPERHLRTRRPMARGLGGARPGGVHARGRPSLPPRVRPVDAH
jgi:hypothetical protein